MADFKPDFPYNTVAYLLEPSYVEIKGVVTPTYPLIGEMFFCSFKTFGGTESEVNGVYSIADTANIETWYRPDIKANCRIKLCENGAVYEIINEPEDINMRHQFLKFKVRRVKGGA